MFKSLAIAASAIVIATAAPAAPSGGSKGQDKAQPTGAKEKRYCIAYEKVVGSRVTQTECKTKSEWARDRVDIDEMLKS